ncbi:MAG TPA: NAD(P)H-binding protein [Chitinophagaceae bacterium]
MKKILVIGASGMLGKPVTKQLSKAGFELTLLARNIPSMRDIYPSARIIEGDVLDPLSLVAAMDGQDAIYVNLQAPRGAHRSYPLPEREGINNVVDAATYAGIKRIAYLSSLVQNYNGTDGYHWWIFDMKQSAVQRIRSSGIPYTIFFASSFMECLDQLMMQGNKILLAGESKVPMHFIAGEDFGRQVARSFELPGDDNHEYVIQGTEAYNWDDAAHIFIDNYKKTRLKTMKAPMGMMKFFGIFSGKAEYGYKICTALNNYPETFDAERTWRELGKPEMTLAQYARKVSDAG